MSVQVDSWDETLLGNGLFVTPPPRVPACCDPFSKRKAKKFKGNDADLAREMNEMSVKDREKIFDDVHGVSQTMEETPEFVDKCIKDLDKALSNIPVKKRRAYTRALFLKPTLETDTKFKLMFLRADHYDAFKAAERMVKYYEQKCVLWGEDKLVKRITMSDLNETDMEVHRLGCNMELPFKDQTGRPIFLLNCPKFDLKTMPIESTLRCFWYVVMTSMHDEMAQKKGVRMIAYSSGPSFVTPSTIGKATDLSMWGGSLLLCLPFRCSSLHICHDDPRMDALVRAIRVAAGRETRLRLRTHLGSDIEIEYELTTFGMRCGGLLQMARAGDKSLPQQCMQRQLQIDKRLDEEEARKEASCNVVSYPQPNDVLLGRGQPFREFPGSMVWNHLLHSQVEKYVGSTSRFEKTCLTMDVVKSIQARKGRFLERTHVGWIILDDIDAREKTASAFRSRAKIGTGDGANGKCDSNSESSSSSSSRKMEPFLWNSAKRQRRGE